MAFWWRAIYGDGAVVDELPGLSSEAIDREKLKRFELRAGAADVLAIEFDEPGRRLVFRRRTDVVGGVPTATCVLVGWNAADGLHIWRVSEGTPPVPEPFPDIELVPCEVL